MKEVKVKRERERLCVEIWLHFFYGVDCRCTIKKKKQWDEFKKKNKKI